ncbi:agamous-like MADS-box AGL80 [Olea europaea subsp. europaea]|uniref:Agamous-like MADS-box AGL80 n=1 Tax=Olea europaea subsp. europaea TaxID=158383 RepID=A0A8S0VJ95_OLEEU|nr:agamous-like MADS-box AGL80 [Olea europaea subsp. europaea]
MTRKKVKLAFITNDLARKATFKKRKKGLMKKVSELSTLCGIDICAIIYSPYESQPEVWPDNRGIHHVLVQFKRIPEMERSKKMVNQESFIRQRIIKFSEQLKKHHKESREKKITQVMYQCLMVNGLQNLMMLDLNDLGWLLDQNLKDINKRIDELKKTTAPPPPPPQQVAPPPPQVPTGNLYLQEQKPTVDLTMDAMQRPHCFTDWMNNPSDHRQVNSFGHGDEMMLPFCENNHNTMWSNAFFP